MSSTTESKLVLTIELVVNKMHGNKPDQLIELSHIHHTIQLTTEMILLY
jgi:hypothetical protein